MPEPLHRQAEKKAAEWLTLSNYGQAMTTGKGRDGGLDIYGPDLVGQVKHHMKPIGRPAIQQLVGARGSDTHKRMWFFSLSGYSRDAITYANKEGVNLVRYDENWNYTAANAASRSVIHLSSPVPAPTGFTPRASRVSYWPPRTDPAPYGASKSASDPEWKRAMDGRRARREAEAAATTKSTKTTQAASSPADGDQKDQWDLFVHLVGWLIIPAAIYFGFHWANSPHRSLEFAGIDVMSVGQVLWATVGGAAITWAYYASPGWIRGVISSVIALALALCGAVVVVGFLVMCWLSLVLPFRLMGFK